MKHTVADIQRFCTHDGPGIRTTVFLKGCPLHCFWCHNPETNSEKQQIFFYENKCIGCGGCVCENGAHNLGEMHSFDRRKCVLCGSCVQNCVTGALCFSGKSMESNQIIDLACRDKAFYGQTGGLTLSGGEPMLHPDRCLELLTLAQKTGLNTAVETSGFFPKEYVAGLCNVTDCFLWDIKDTDDERHLENTGVSNKQILENLYLADSFSVPIIIRCVLLSGVNLKEEHIRSVKELFYSLKNAVKVDFLPCHTLGNAKAESLGMEYRDLSIYTPTPQEMQFVQSYDKWVK